MGYRLHQQETVVDGVRRIGRAQIDKARADIGRPDRVEAVHQARKRCKRLRGLVRLVRPALGKGYARENTRFRDIARTVSDVRDAQVLQETFDTLMAACDDRIDRRHYAPLRQQLVAKAESISDADLADRLGRMDDALAAARTAVADWQLSRTGFAALGPGFTKTYKRARRQGRQAFETTDTERWHDWRKRVKYHRFHCQLLAGAWPRPLKARAKELDRLGDLLGDEHDLAVLQTWLAHGGNKLRDDNQQALTQLIAERRTALRRQAVPLGQCLFADKPRVITDRMARYWHAAGAATATD
ncbi:CHAD domain-containing protein [Salinisphaera sp. Q1T1-3]|uniref:CHAD domain-containing protein n=1 Tax=Salinisphaera sp. Q1T1-3 TaxID=2321229 RepID=UPI000E7200FA|nr:CHAD domain-containing protein [Salinisphaera sp. Q1T1-3]RJS93247.1 CHAD domain-containing protein [Salinisphaera sp. Q1T1-3]